MIVETFEGVIKVMDIFGIIVFSIGILTIGYYIYLQLNQEKLE